MKSWHTDSYQQDNYQTEFGVGLEERVYISYLLDWKKNLGSSKSRCGGKDNGFWLLAKFNKQFLSPSVELLEIQR